MKQKRFKEWLLLLIDEEYHLKTIEEFLSDFCHRDVAYWCDGRILLNQHPVSGKTLLQKGDTLQVLAFPNEEVDYPSDAAMPEVEYEDDFVLVVNKPKGMIIYPSKKDGDGTLANLVAHYYREKDIHTTVRPLHRLDLDTTGLVLFSKSPFLQPKLDQMMRKKEIVREYYAFVEGRVEKDGTINRPIGKDRHDAKKMRVSKTGKEAITHFEVVRYQKKFTLLKCKLDTGRTHQIRVHLSSIGHPIVNDVLYGEKYDKLPFGLQAFRLTWENPITHKKQIVEIPCLF